MFCLSLILYNDFTLASFNTFGKVPVWKEILKCGLMLYTDMKLVGRWDYIKLASQYLCGKPKNDNIYFSGKCVLGAFRPFHNFALVESLNLLYINKYVAN